MISLSPRQMIIHTMTKGLMAKYNFVYARVKTKYPPNYVPSTKIENRVVIKKADGTYAYPERLIEIEAQKAYQAEMTTSIIKEVKAKIERRVLGESPILITSDIGSPNEIKYWE